MRTGRRIKTCFCTVALLLTWEGLSYGGGWKGQSVAEKYGLTKRLEQEIWRDGRPDTEFCLSILRESLTSGNRDYVGAVYGQLMELIRRRYIDVSRFTEILVALREFEGEPAYLAHGLEVELALWGMGEKERRRVYKNALEKVADGWEEPIEAGGVQIRMWWLDAARRVVEEEMDDVAPLIETAIAKVRERPNKTILGNRVLLRLEHIQLPLARARRSRTLAKGYVRELAAMLEKEPVGGYGLLDREEMAREVMLGLVRRGEQSVVDEVKALWAQEHKRLREIEEVRARRWRREPVSWGVPGEGAALYLVAGIRALDDAGFEQKLWKELWFPESPEEIRKRLVKQGLVKEVKPDK